MVSASWLQGLGSDVGRVTETLYVGRKYIGIFIL